MVIPILMDKPTCSSHFDEGVLKREKKIDSLFFDEVSVILQCDAPNPEGPLTTRQPAEYS